MKTIELIKEIQKLPVSKRIYVIEKTIHSIRKQDENNRMKMAAEALYSDYESDEDLKVFTVLDCEKFYETR
jgi:hypothetical protein